MREPLHASQDLHDLPVYDADQTPFGATYGVLAEADTGLVRFFDVAIEGRQRHVLIPVGHARLEKSLGRMRLRLRAATINELEQIPAYEPHVVWHEEAFQNELLDAFGKLFQGQRYYAHPAYDHAGLYAGTHPLMREPLAAKGSGLQRLSAAHDFRVAEGEQDVRGWELLDRNSLRIGVVNDLIIDADAEQVRYLVIRREGDDKEIALPIGYVDLGDKSVRTDLTPDDFAALPEMTAETLARDEEMRLRLALDNRLDGDRKYLRPDFRPAA